MVFNPLAQVVKSLTLPLYHTGLTGTAAVREREDRPDPSTRPAIQRGTGCCFGAPLGDVVRCGIAVAPDRLA